MGLQWVRLDVAFPRNPKILALLGDKDGYRAALVWVCSLAYAGEQGTDGFIPRYALAHLHGRDADARKLVIHNLWRIVPAGIHRAGSEISAPPGWMINGWAEFQPSTAETQERSAKAQVAARKAACIRWHGTECGCWDATG